MKKNNYSDRRGGGIFLVLVPHRDVRLVLRNYSASLFKAGLAGAYHFPWAAPLAALSRPLNTEELKYFARAVRQAAGEGKISAGEMAAAAFPADEDGAMLLGTRLDIAIPPSAFNSEKVTRFFSPPVIGSCLMSAAEYKVCAIKTSTVSEISAIPPVPQLSFRAAAVANMFWRPLEPDTSGARTGGLGYKWKIGKLCWLPASKKQ